MILIYGFRLFRELFGFFPKIIICRTFKKLFDMLLFTIQLSSFPFLTQIFELPIIMPTFAPDLAMLPDSLF